MLENCLSLGYATCGAFVILCDLITLGLATFCDFVTMASYTHLSTLVILGLISDRTLGPVI